MASSAKETKTKRGNKIAKRTTKRYKKEQKKARVREKKGLVILK